MVLTGPMRGAHHRDMEDKPKQSLWERWNISSNHGYIYDFLDEVQKDMDAKDEEIRRRTRDVDHWLKLAYENNDERAEFAAEVERLREEVQQLQDELNVSRKDTSSAIHQVEKLWKELEVKGQVIQQWNEILESQRRMINILWERRRERQGKIDDLEAKATALSKDLEAQKKRQDDLRGIICRSDVTINKQVREIHDLNAHIARRNGVIERMRGRIKDLSDENEILKEQVKKADDPRFRSMINDMAVYRLGCLKSVAKIARDESESVVDRIVTIQNLTEDYKS